MHRRFTREERGSLERHTQAGSRINVIASDLRSKNQALKNKDILNEGPNCNAKRQGPIHRHSALSRRCKNRKNSIACVAAPTNALSEYSGPFRGVEK